MKEYLVGKGLVVVIIIIIFLFIGSNVVSGFNIQLKNTTYPLITGSSNTLYVGGTGEGNYTKIQDAIDNASDGDTVFVYNDSSPYNENVNVNKSINLFGEERDTTVIDGCGIDSTIEVSANHVYVEGFTITNCQKDLSEAGINILSDLNTIKNTYENTSQS